MSFLKKIFGRNFDESVTHAEDLLRSGYAGDARLEFERALSKAKGEPADRKRYVQRKIDECRDELALAHIEEGKVFAEQGEVERALECFETAAEVARGQDIVREARNLIEGLEATDARIAYEEADEVTDEERFQILSGAWEDERADELEEYGERFRQAFLDLHDGRPQQSVEVMKELLEENPEAVFLRLELGLANYHAGLLKEAIPQLRSFLRKIEEEFDPADKEDEDEEDEDEEDEAADEETAALVGQGARIQAHARLAEIYLELGDAEHAEKELRELLDLLPDKSDPYVHLGSFLREQGRLDEAMDILEQGRRYMGEMRPDMRVVREIGLTQRALGDKAAAIESLKGVISYQTAMADYNFNPDAAVPLAELYEEQGELERASDIYRHLAAGTHAAGHFFYNREAGRLLGATGKSDLAGRHLARALELAPNEEERSAVQVLIDELN